MKKYILSAAITLPLAISAVAAKDNSYDVDFSIAKTFFYDNKVFKQKFENPTVHTTQSNDTVATLWADTSAKLLDSLFFDHKIGSSFSRNRGDNMWIAVELFAINPVNYFKNGLVASQYQVDELKLQDFAISYKDTATPDDNSDEFLLIGLLTKDIPYKYSIECKNNTDACDNNAQSQNFVTKEIFSALKKKNSVSLGDEGKNKGHTIQLILKECKEKSESLSLIDEGKNKGHTIQLILKDFKVKRSVKALFLNTSLYKNININNKFSSYFVGKVGWGHLDIQQDIITTFDTITLNAKIQDGPDKMQEQEVTKMPQTNKNSQASRKLGLPLKYTQNGFTFVVNVAVGCTYTTTLSPLQFSIDGSISVYGNPTKEISCVIYQEDKAGKLTKSSSSSNSEVMFDKAVDKSWFGPIDASISVGVKINL